MRALVAGAQDSAELYHLALDPQENWNVVAEPDYQEVRASFGRVYQVTLSTQVVRLCSAKLRAGWRDVTK